jgi:dTDP-4-amino-4,6-dideoxygalactose transaminase
VLLPRGIDRDLVIATMQQRGIGAGAYYPRLVWDYPPYRDNPHVVVDETPNAADIAARCLSLPVRPELGEPELSRVAGALVDAVAAQIPG